MAVSQQGQGVSQQGQGVSQQGQGVSQPGGQVQQSVPGSSGVSSSNFGWQQNSQPHPVGSIQAPVPSSSIPGPPMPGASIPGPPPIVSTGQAIPSHASMSGGGGVAPSGHPIPPGGQLPLGAPSTGE